MSEDTFIIP
jgi:WD40 repeat protein